MRKIAGIAAVCAFLLGMFVAGCVSQSQRQKIDGYLVDSVMSLPFESFNERLNNAANEKESWVYDPVRIALEYMNSSGARLVDIRRTDESAEESAEGDSTTVRVVEDGYADDSVRGTWTRLKMTRAADHSWRIVDARRAYRCWRSDRDAYRAQPCP